MSNLRYPQDDKMKGTQGKVVVTFIIDANGKVTEAKIIRGVSSNIDKEAIRLVNATSGWKPASQNGQPKSMMVTMPVEFNLSN
jgi:TonB family protein